MKKCRVKGQKQPEKLTYMKIYGKDKITLVYEGETFNGRPCGTGTVYFANGNKYQEGEFYVKGLISGREYYPDGQLRFEGQFRLNWHYGPNCPVRGKCYAPDGRLIYEGELKRTASGLGWPMILEPEEYGPVVQTGVKPDIEYMTWKDKREYEEEGFAEGSF